MKLTDYILAHPKPFVTFEILPPLKGSSIQSVYDILDPLMDFQPPFINVTYHRAEYMYRKMPGGFFKKVITRKRPGTVSICASIMNRYKIQAVPHLTCGGFTVEDTEDALIDLNYIGVKNVLALRGDAVKSEASFTPDSGGHAYAGDLVRQIQRMNNGLYLEDDLTNGIKTDFCIGVAGYPEKHFEAPNMKTDLLNLKKKVDEGAAFIVTQMFFDNQKYFEFVRACREMDIHVPIIPGLKPITRKRQMTMLPRIFHVDLPAELSENIEKSKSDAEVQEVGIDWCIRQSKELAANQVPCLHFYTMGQTDVITQITKAVF